MKDKPKKRLEKLIIVILSVAFGTIWLLAHWNLSRQPPHHKGPGSVGYEEPITASPLNTDSE